MKTLSRPVSVLKQEPQKQPGINMQKTIKFIVGLFASFCSFYLLILVAKAYAWTAIPFIILFIILLWKQDKTIGIGAFTAFMISVLAIIIILCAAPGMKTVF